MSRFLSRDVVPYVPGEQPSGGYLKLNTNESPYPPSQNARRMAKEELERGALYPDPTCRALREALADELGVKDSQILCANGSDAVLNYAFAAFCHGRGPVYADLTYGFYSSLAGFYGEEPTVIPLKEDFTVDVEAFASLPTGCVVFLPNPNAPTGIALAPSDIERIVRENADNAVIIDEAYVDFGTQSAVRLIERYPNLCVTRTFSKSRSLAGERLGFAVACEELIEDLNAVKFSLDPYCVSRSAMASGIGSLKDREYFLSCRDRIMEARDYTVRGLRRLGFIVTDSAANFVFCRSERISGSGLYSRLRQKGILVRHFGGRAEDYVRVTIGTMNDMRRFLEAAERIIA